MQDQYQQHKPKDRRKNRRPENGAILPTHGFPSRKRVLANLDMSDAKKASRIPRSRIRRQPSQKLPEPQTVSADVSKLQNPVCSLLGKERQAT
jgi:hypothetical protein